MSSKRKNRVRIIPPHQPEARDEGPRLLPLKDSKEEQSRHDELGYYVQLANIALGLPHDDRPQKERR
jgi:hypothetical protein